MNVACPECRSMFRVDPAKIPAGGVRARCSVCGGVITVASENASQRVAAVGAGVAPGNFAPAPRPAPGAGGLAQFGASGAPTAPGPRPPAASAPIAPAPSARPPAAAQPQAQAGFQPPRPAPISAPPPSRVTPTGSRPPAPPRPQTLPGLPPIPPPPGARPPAAAPAPPPPQPMRPMVRPLTPPVGQPSAPASPPRPPAFGAVAGAAPSTQRPPAQQPPAGMPAPRPPSFGGAPNPIAPPRPAGPGTPLAPRPAAPAPPGGAPPARAPINPFLANDPNAKAKRLARALVSDIVAYHPQKRDEGVRNNTLAQLFKDGTEIPYNVLEGSFMQFATPQATLAYAESLAAVEYIRDTYGISEIPRILERLAHGSSTEAALRSTIHADYRQLRDDLGRWLKDKYGE